MILHEALTMQARTEKLSVMFEMFSCAASTDRSREASPDGMALKAVPSFLVQGPSIDHPPATVR